MTRIDIANTPSLDLDLLRTFVAVVDAGGFTRAGTRVHRTQSTVSQQIRRLEEDLGCRLIDRDGGSVAPTEEGEVLMGYALRLLAISAEARAALNDPGCRAVVRLGVPEDFAGRQLTDLLSGFAKICPHIRLDTTSGWSAALHRALDADDLDLSYGFRLKDSFDDLPVVSDARRTGCGCVAAFERGRRCPGSRPT